MSLQRIGSSNAALGWAARGQMGWSEQCEMKEGREGGREGRRGLQGAAGEGQGEGEGGWEGTEAQGNQSTGKRRMTESDNNQVQLFTTIKGVKFVKMTTMDDLHVFKHSALTGNYLFWLNYHSDVFLHFDWSKKSKMFHIDQLTLC